MPTAIATVNGVEIGRTDKAQVVEGNQYFPPDSIKKEFYHPSAKNTSTHCPWKGDASYYDLDVNGTKISDGAWFYPKTITEKAAPIQGWVAFYLSKGIKVTVE